MLKNIKKIYLIFKYYFIEEFLIKGNIFIDLKVLKRIVYYVFPILVIFFLLISFLFKGEVFEESGEVFGQASLNLIFFILFLKPISFIFNEFGIFRKLLTLRRELGISAFYFGFLHSVFSINNLGVFSVESFKQVVLGIDSYFYGFVGTVILFLLFITSNNLSVRILKRNWKRLQRLVYVAVIVIIIHVILVKNEGLEEGMGYFLVILIYIVLKVLEYKKVQFKVLKYFEMFDEKITNN